MAEPPAIVLVRPDAVTDADKTALREAGVVVVETDDPDGVRFIQAGHELPTSTMLLAAAKGVLSTEAAQRAFGRALAEALVGQEQE